MEDEVFFEDIFKPLIEGSKVFVIEYGHKMHFYGDDEYISYFIKAVNGLRFSHSFKAGIKKLCKEGLDKLKEVLDVTPYENRLSLLEYVSEEFAQFQYYVQEKVKIEEENEWGAEKRYPFLGFVNAEFIGEDGENPYHQDSIEYKAEDFAKSWREAINETKNKIDFMLHQMELLPEPRNAIKDKNIIQIFYSWQSDNETERRFIWKSLRKIETYFKSIGKTIKVESDMRGVPGSQDIPNTLFKKIETSDIFLADVNLVCKSLFRIESLSPNPNVLIELGYAASKLGWDRVLLTLNTKSNKIEELPFDIRQRSILWYNADSNEDLTEKLKVAIRSIISSSNDF